MSMLFSRTFLAAIAAFAIAATAFAQATNPPETEVPAGPAAAAEPVPANPLPPTVGQPATTQTVPSGQAVHNLTQLLVAANQNEIEMARFGQDRTQNQGVRDFANNMISEHQDFINKLQQAASAAETAPGVAPQAAAPGRPPSVLTQILKDAGNRQVTLIHNELANKQGSDFDQSFIGSQLAAHFAMLATLQASVDHTSGQLQQVINEGIQATQRHIDHANFLMGQLEQARVQQAAKPPETQQR